MATPTLLPSLLAQAEAMEKTSPAMRIALDVLRRNAPPGMTDFKAGSPAHRALHNVAQILSDSPPVVSGKPTKVVKPIQFKSSPKPLQFAAPVGNERPVTIVARTPEVANQGYWGRCVHDMAGFIPPTGPVPIDFGHCEDEPGDAIGVADSVAVVGGQLVASGRLISTAPDDPAAQVIAKGTSGVPFQASISMDMNLLQAVQVADGQTMPVNGTDFVGPGYVFTQWGIVGIAVCLYGADTATSVQFGQSLKAQVLAHFKRR